MKPRLIAMSRNGRFVAIRQSGGVDLVDALGTNPRRQLSFEEVADFTFLGNDLWVAANEGIYLLGAESSESPDKPAAERQGPGILVAATGDGARAVLWRGHRQLLLSSKDEAVEVNDLGDDLSDVHYAKPLRAGWILLEQEGKVSLRDPTGKLARTFPGELEVESASELFGGRVFALQTRSKSERSIRVLQPSGAPIHQIKLPAHSRADFAETRGLGLAYTREQLQSIDLRYGRELGVGEVPLQIEAAAIDASGKFIAIAGYQDGSKELSVLHLPYTSVFAPKRRKPSAAAQEVATPPSEKPEGHELKSEPTTELDAAEISGADEEAYAPEPSEEPEAEEPVEVPDSIPTALGLMPPLPRRQAPVGFVPYERVDQHLEELVELISARAALAIAEAWNSGQLSLPSRDSLPFEHEVLALVGERANAAADAVRDARQRVDELARQVAGRAQASLAAGKHLPFFELVTEFGLSRTAAQALVVAAAPQVRGEVARLFGVLANDEGRPICDRYLIELILGGSDRESRQDVARELEADSPLIHFGLIRVLPAPPDMYLFAPITVDPVLIARLRGHPFAAYEAGSVTEIQRADKEIGELAIVDEVKRDIVVDLAEPPLDGRPVRVVVRGRPGSGRTSLLAALAARVGRALAIIDCERLPREGRPLAQRLRIELRRAALRGALPCVSGIEVSESAEAEGLEHLRDMFRSHPGPVLIRTTPEYRPPLAPGYLEYTIPPLSEGKRRDFWAQSCERAGIKVDESILASRFRIGPGTIDRIVSNVRMRLDAGALEKTDDYTDEVDQTARQHIDTRLSSVASRVTRLARWEQVALPDDLLDSVREFIGRVRHRRTVYESWGFDRKMSTSRGLTALFYGPPGTGKTMVSGLIARELNLDLYRVDLARITSKWVGETEKNLAQIFDAAEDGQAVVVFDEADSLFAKRTEVKSSVDKYANLEVNYLLQRLDSFEGIAILTTNLEGSIDTAFKRRLSLRLAFPFPDEEMRVRLWSAHIPPELPTTGDFDFEDLANRFPMSGGYIRNSTIRAAFLAAQEGQPLSQEHLLRAIHLEYREMGKLSAGGRIE